MIKILVVEDDRAINEIICSGLIKNGYQATACYNGRQAVEYFEDNQVDLIITDVMMPEMDGFALASQVREADS
ncbi:MAG: response regulator transcription factor, partial [Candidatus Coproplasma sp.]